MKNDKASEEKNKKESDDEIEIDIFGQELSQTDELDGDYEIDNNDIVTTINPESDHQKEAVSGAINSIQKKREITNDDPSVSSNDIDANWQDSNVTGEESSLGSNPTPDQDQVDSISEPWGTSYDYDQELDVNKKEKKLKGERQHDETEDLNNQ